MKFQEDAINKINLALSKKSDKSLASGFKRAVRTGDNTFSIYFMDDSKIDLTIPLPANGKDGKDGIDGINGRDGLNGTNGKDGKDGAGISNITASQSGENVTLTISLTDGTNKQVTFTAPHASGGSSENIKVLMDSDGKVLMDSNGKVLTISV